MTSLATPSATFVWITVEHRAIPTISLTELVPMVSAHRYSSLHAGTVSILTPRITSHIWHILPATLTITAHAHLPILFTSSRSFSRSFGPLQALSGGTVPNNHSFGLQEILLDTDFTETLSTAGTLMFFRMLLTDALTIAVSCLTVMFLVICSHLLKVRRASLPLK